MPLIVKNCSINMYVDDTALYTANTNAFKAADSVRKDLTAIHKWCLPSLSTLRKPMQCFCLVAYVALLHSVIMP